MYVVCAKDRADALFKQVHVSKTLKGRSNDAIGSACLYIACRQEGVPRTFKGLCQEFYNISYFIVSKCQLFSLHLISFVFIQLYSAFVCIHFILLQSTFIFWLTSSAGVGCFFCSMFQKKSKIVTYIQIKFFVFVYFGPC